MSADPAPPDSFAPDLAVIEGIALAARDALAPPWAGPAREVLIRVEEMADDQMLADLEMDDPFELTGLYEGIPMTHKSVLDMPERPDTIWLFRRAILDEWVDRGNVTLTELVTHVLIHEFAHHFGWSDEDIARVDQWWD
ncbi:metallopeptidase family protein [Gymnodinialimonas ceratoperidinii]|uniref:Metallopeptidase family protein n=1 Tax=Gymnodinialimonas ceratoperidinii TaxID=2856823 RepID=A0A8F6YBH1_9RHOB|nr:metallopeptidase family protein [Gymnodinialimonas ceratoperidinii]QXT40553.1 metallopeptidase family protein [Gymnodinialimonas ceratoperidinii]